MSRATRRLLRGGSDASPALPPMPRLSPGPIGRMTPPAPLDDGAPRCGGFGGTAAPPLAPAAAATEAAEAAAAVIEPPPSLAVGGDGAATCVVW